jgi:hypothetical protein
LLLRRYLKLAIEISEARQVMHLSLSQASDLPFPLSAIPKYYPPPSELRLWVTD